MEAISGAAFAMKKLHGMHFTVSHLSSSFLFLSAGLSHSIFQTGALCSTLYRSVQRIF